MLRESVVAAHAEQKILVAAPHDEVARICPGEDRVLGAGAVLRLGGALLGGYGEQDISYAYRQLSRALHPDKNPDIREAAGAAFRRLSEAADELRQGLAEQRHALHLLTANLGVHTTSEMLERPQEALFADASRFLTAVLGISGEGKVPRQARPRAAAAFTQSPAFSCCSSQVILSEWFEKTDMLDLLASAPVRAAYDCAPKRFRAQFLCMLNRCVVVEAKRCQDCVRHAWGEIFQAYPELGPWRKLRDHFASRCWPTPEDEAARRSRSHSRTRTRRCNRGRGSRSRSGSRRRDEGRGDGDDRDIAESSRRRPEGDELRFQEPEERPIRRRRHNDGLCGDFQKGNCFRGDSCKFSHERRTRQDDGATSVWRDEDYTGGREVRPGDWTCQSCGEHVFARKDACWKCGAPKNESGQPVDGIKLGDQGGERRRGRRRDVGWSSWARRWREAMRAVLPSGSDCAVPPTDPEVRKLATALWKDMVVWALQTEPELAGQGLIFFQSEPPPEGVNWPARGLPPGPPCEWAFAPATDLLLVVGEGAVGITAEGIFADNRSGHKRRSFDTAWWLRDDFGEKERHEDRHEESHGQGSFEDFREGPPIEKRSRHGRSSYDDFGEGAPTERRSRRGRSSYDDFAEGPPPERRSRRGRNSHEDFGENTHMEKRSRHSRWSGPDDVVHFND